MPRKKLALPPGATVHVVRETWQRRWLLLPGGTFDEQVLGIVGRALAFESVAVHALTVLPDRLELLATVSERDDLSGFLKYVMKFLREAIKASGRWDGPLWELRPPRVTVVPPEHTVDRLRDIVTAPVRDGLVASPFEWPLGVADALVEERVILSMWKQRLQPIALAPLPTLEHFSTPVRQALLRDLLTDPPIPSPPPLGLAALRACSPRASDPRAE